MRDEGTADIFSSPATLTKESDDEPRTKWGYHTPVSRGDRWRSERRARLEGISKTFGTSIW